MTFKEYYEAGDNTPISETCIPVQFSSDIISSIVVDYASNMKRLTNFDEEIAAVLEANEDVTPFQEDSCSVSYVKYKYAEVALSLAEGFKLNHTNQLSYYESLDADAIKAVMRASFTNLIPQRENYKRETFNLDKYLKRQELEQPVEDFMDVAIGYFHSLYGA